MSILSFADSKDVFDGNTATRSIPFRQSFEYGIRITILQIESTDDLVQRTIESLDELDIDTGSHQSTENMILMKGCKHGCG